MGALGLVVVVALLATGLREEPASVDRAVDLQLRPVLQVSQPTEPAHAGLTPACDPGPVCPDDVPGSEEIVLEDAQGARYRLAPAAFTAADVGDARPEEQPDGSWGVVVRLRLEATEPFRELTGEAAALPPPRNRLAIVVDGALVSAPIVQAEIPVGTFVIVGDLDRPGAAALAARLAP
jgi:preprotein translocase subunit SecD